MSMKRASDDKKWNQARQTSFRFHDLLIDKIKEWQEVTTSAFSTTSITSSEASSTSTVTTKFSLDASSHPHLEEAVAHAIRESSAKETEPSCKGLYGALAWKEIGNIFKDTCEGRRKTEEIEGYRQAVPVWAANKEEDTVHTTNEAEQEQKGKSLGYDKNYYDNIYYQHSEAVARKATSAMYAYDTSYYEDLDDSKVDGDRHAAAVASTPKKDNRDDDTNLTKDKTTKDPSESNSEEHLKEIHSRLSERFHTALAKSKGKTPNEEMARAEGIKKVMDEFRERATKVSSEIIEDMNIVPLKKRRHKPDGRFGGVAGGEKYYDDGIVYKFARDIHNLYGGDEWVGKAADNELRALNQVLNLGIPRLQIPLMAIIDYRGSRIIAISHVDIDDENSLVYGTADGGETIKDGSEKNEGGGVASSSAEVLGIVEKMGKSLGLAPHMVVERSTRRLCKIHGVADMEIHHDPSKGNFYVIDTARLFPPTCPRLDIGGKGSVLYNQLRPELVARCCSSLPGMTQGLSPDVFTGFGQAPGGRKLGENVSKATAYLLKQVIPDACRWLVATKKTLDNSNLAPTLHAQGINLRFMGIMRRILIEMTSSAYDEEREKEGGERNQDDRVADREFANSLAHTLLMEMISRQMKIDLRSLMRRNSGTSTSSLTKGNITSSRAHAANTEVVSQYLALALCYGNGIRGVGKHATLAKIYWDRMRVVLPKKFCACLTKEELELISCSSSSSRSRCHSKSSTIFNKNGSNGGDQAENDSVPSSSSSSSSLSSSSFKKLQAAHLHFFLLVVLDVSS